MFYAKASSGKLRLGDIVTGYVTAVPSHSEPITKCFVDYNIDVKLNPYLVILTPCCSIGDKTISVVPLTSAKRKQFFKNTNYRSDMTLLNQPHLPERWQEFGEEVTTISEVDPIYTNDNLFIYAEDKLLPKYRVKIPSEKNTFEEFEAGYYFIDFRNISKVKCACVVAEEEENPNYKDLLMKMLSSKILELSIDTRSDLRNKLAFYFSRRPAEDLGV